MWHALQPVGTGVQQMKHVIHVQVFRRASPCASSRQGSAAGLVLPG